MHASGAHVGGRNAQAIRNLPLHVEVPLELVSLGRILLHEVSRCTGSTGDRRSQGKGSRRIVHVDQWIERYRVVHISAEQVRQREDVEHTESGANRGFAAAGGIPGKANPGSEILVRGVLEIRVAGEI